ncbi:hypothetical protein TGP89_365830 [Toxoplasma gondii p89]|uniref:Secreted protein n=1 Tax=Toxoplasma gondii p89 TaxID=943119 RepID=A0A086JRK3_TOXGO|nr:hypothetical protein TGP89_365830 [Toxoplasma gondii p89]
MHTAIFVHLCMPVFLRCLQGTPWRVAAASRFNAFLCGGSQRQTSPTVSPRGLRVSRNRAPAANGLPPLRQRTAVARQAAAEVEARGDESGVPTVDSYAKRKKKEGDRGKSETVGAA